MKKEKSKSLPKKGTAQKTKSIKKTLLVGIIGLSISITALFGLINGFILYNQTLESVESRLNENTIAYRQSVEHALQVYESKIEAISQNTFLVNPSLSVSQKEMVLKQLAEENGFEALSIADSEGVTLEGAEVGEREYFKQALEGNTYISSTLVSSVTNDVVLIAATKLKSSSYNGIVYARLKSATFSEMIDDVTVGESGYAFILDKDGKMIAHKNNETVVSQTNYIEMAAKDKNYSSVAEMTKKMIAGGTDSISITFNGTRQIVSYTPIPGTDGWSIGVTAKTSEMLQTFYLSIALTFGLAVLFFILAFIVAFRIATPIVNPIINLVKRIEGLAEGDLHSEVPLIETNNEIGILSKSFSSTISTLNAYIGEISDVLSCLATRNCTVSAKLEYKGDFALIQDSLTKIVTNLNQVFSKIKDSAEQVADGASQVAVASQSLAAGASEQASTVEELTAAITTIEHQAEENVKNVHSAKEFVSQAAKGLQKGNSYMQTLDHAMEEITSSSEKISNITKVIEDIAFQTNILALNAAIEAARAGSAGKGFAVVADEVRNLAAKSAEAAQQTAELIEYSSLSVMEGEKIAKETSVVLSETAEKAMREVEKAISDIDAASSSQAESIEQITMGLSQVSAVVQNNAATAEESSASSEELAGQADVLRDEVEKFKLSQDNTECGCSGEQPALLESEIETMEEAFDEESYFPDKY